MRGAGDERRKRTMINWKVRYGRVLDLYPELRSSRHSILEVGSGGSGIRGYLDRPVVGVDLCLAHAAKAAPLGIAGDVAKLPFRENAFDYVLCLDTLEHVEPALRPAAMRELARVACRKLIIGMPMGAFSAWSDAQYFLSLKWRAAKAPEWLLEHLTHGIPDAGKIVRAVAELDLSFQLHGNETLIQHYAGLLADEMSFLSQANRLLDTKHVDGPPIGAGAGDVYYSYLIEASKPGPCYEVPSTTQLASPPSQRQRPDSAAFDIDLYCVGHDPHRFLSLAGYRSFFVGKTLPDAFCANPAAVCDDRRHSIVERNPSYSEMTAIYSAWKNVRHQEFVGFCHYRRIFDFLVPSGAQRNRHIHTREELEAERPAMEAVSAVRSILENGGIVLAGEDSYELTVAEHYMRCHYPDHYLLAFNMVRKHWPHLEPYAIRQFESRTCYLNNMFICSATFFDELCTWWFDILFRLEREIALPRDPYQHRVLAFLSERLFDIFVRWKLDSGTPSHSVPTFFLHDSVFC
jgi:hypothetical protein